MEKDINARAAKRTGCKVREPMQNARANAKCVNPRKVLRPTQSARAVLWVRGTPSARTRAKCVGRGSIARAALTARAAIGWRGEWAALPTHLPRTCHSMPMQCNPGSTRVGRDEPQSPGSLRVNTLRPTQNGCHFAYDIFKCIFLNENVWIPIKISLKFVPKGPINNIPALVQIMAWRRPGDKPLSEPMMVSLPTHICVSRPQWVNGIYCRCCLIGRSWLHFTVSHVSLSQIHWYKLIET